MMTNRSIHLGAGAVLSLIVVLTGPMSCHRGPTSALPDESRVYPYDRDTMATLDVQIFRDGPKIEVFNHTVDTFMDFRLWLNERFVYEIDVLPAGESIELSLFDFHDEYGEAFRGGGLFARYEPDPLVKAEMETEDGLFAFVAIPEPGF
ncbi:MAG: hypothetical protein ACF8PN_14765 [Phycisphaerales bacterium]